MIFCTKWFKRKDNIEEKQRFEQIKQKQEPILKELIKNETKSIHPIDALINEALDKLIPKIYEKHFSPEIQKALKEMKGLINVIYFRVDPDESNYTSSNLMRADNYKVIIELDNITTHQQSIYDYKSNKYVKDHLIQEVRFYGQHPPYRLFIEYLYDYFFNGELEKDIEEQTKSNRNYKERKEKEKLEAADKLCKLINTEKV